MDQIAKQSIVDRIKQASNVLITVKKDPNVDQLAACIGLTLFLNKMGKHATAVFSGGVPSTLEFLKPEDTIEKNTDSLRDFIIALDKSKADKLRYKVEDKVVKIFITPYKASLSEKDLDYSQGDFNVDVVFALGVNAQTDIDDAITAHGRILHDATTISVSNGPKGGFGTLQLEDTQASSLCEILVDLCDTMSPDSFDAQMATAFLTGVVAETERFGNSKTSPRTMTISAKLMAAGANQQLIATKLQPHQVASGKLNISSDSKIEATEAGTLNIDHKAEQATETTPSVSLPEPVDEIPAPSSNQTPDPLSSIGDIKTEVNNDVMDTAVPRPVESNTRPLAPPTMGGTLTASAQSQDNEPSVNPLNDSKIGQTLEHGIVGVDSSQTLDKIEEEVHSPHLENANNHASINTAGLDAARQAVEAAAEANADTITPLTAVGSQPVDITAQGQNTTPAPTPDQPAVQPQTGSTPDFLQDKGQPAEQTSSVKTFPTPPPVPPPMMPPTS